MKEKRKGALGTKGILEVLIFSDSHGAYRQMRRVIENHPCASHVLFCGDGLRDVEALEKDFPKQVFVSVKGNCDGLLSYYDAPYERLFTLGELRVLMMHGHTHGVKGGYGVAAAYAASQGATILLFGHTHLPCEGKISIGNEEIHFFNPGSIGCAYGSAPSYGVLTVKENGYLFSHGTI